MRIIHGGMGRTLKTIPLRELHFHLIPLIPHSAIAKDNPRQIPYIFFIFYSCGKSTFKTTIKTKTTHYYDKLTKHFLIR